ncbi:MAG: hypothetical protein ACP5QA_16900 [Phycisphaerae bacterium]
MSKEIEKTSQSVQYVRRISPSGLRLGMKLPTEPTLIAKIACVINGSTVREAPATGQSATQFTGDFLAVKSDGEQITSHSLFLPEYFAAEIVSMLSDNPNGVKVGIELWFAPSEKSPMGFTYECKFIGKSRPVSEDLLALLKK